MIITCPLRFGYDYDGVASAACQVIIALKVLRKIDFIIMSSANIYIHHNRIQISLTGGEITAIFEK